MDNNKDPIVSNDSPTMPTQTPNNELNNTSQNQIKPTKQPMNKWLKIFLIVSGLGCILSVIIALVIVGLSAAGLVTLWGVNQTIYEKVTEEENNNFEEEQQQEEKNNLVCKLKDFEIEIEIKDQIEKSKDKISIFKSNQYSAYQETYDYDDNAVIYYVGDVTKAAYKNDDLKGYKYYVGDYALYSEYNQTSVYGNIIRFIYKDEKSDIYVLADHSTIQYLSEELLNMNSSSQVTENNVVNLSNDVNINISNESEKECFYPKDFISDTTTEPINSNNIYIYSKEKVMFRFNADYISEDKFGSNTTSVLKIFDKNDYQETTECGENKEDVNYKSCKGTKIYSDKNYRYFTKSLDGFTIYMSIKPDIDYNLDSSPSEQDPYNLTIQNFTLNDGNINKYSYASVNWEYLLSGNSNNKSGYDIQDIDKTELKEIGYSPNNIKIYEYLDTENEFLKKVYNEDYIDLQQYKYNNLTIDDKKPLTYEQYLNYYPVVFWESPYGGYYRYSSYEFIAPLGIAKPAVYLYPENETIVSVKLYDINGKLSYSLPEYEDEWIVSANPSGMLTYLLDNKNYDYLWWESNPVDVMIKDKGYVVEKSAWESTVKSQLIQFGLNSKEISQFIEYWEPRVESETSEYIFITYLFNKEVDYYAKLDITPTPDTVIRVLMFYKPIDSYQEIDDLPIPAMERNGFTVVEWGGARINN